MTRLEAANLIRVFDFYLALVFVISLVRRYLVYWDAVCVVVAVRARWPRLIDRIRSHHRGALVNPDVLRPVALALGLMLIQVVCSRVIWPHARLTVGAVAASYLGVAVAAAAVPMLLVDLYFLVRVGRFDRSETETYLDQAEYWLTGWRAPAVRVLTLGYVNPHRIVDEEVQKGLTALGETVGWSARWVAIQVGCRVACGLTIWLLWAARGWLE